MLFFFNQLFYIELTLNNNRKKAEQPWHQMVISQNSVVLRRKNHKIPGFFVSLLPIIP